MDKKFMGLQSLIALEFLMDPSIQEHHHENFEFLYLLNGSLTVIVEEESFAMKPQDMLLVNSDRRHGFQGSTDAFVARFEISCSKTQELLEQDMILFWCNSVVDKNEAYEELRKILTRIINQYVKYDTNQRIFFNSLYYQMLHVLTSNFLLTAKDVRYAAEKGNTDDRMQEIYKYIRSNYRNSIKLSDLADRLYLSTAYLSKYIKRKCNASFIELLNTVRLNYAMEELLYTDSSIMKIAMDNGFASVAAYNKAFKEAYQKTPSEFRKHIASNKNQVDRAEAIEQEQLVQDKISSYLEQTIYLEETEQNSGVIQILINLAETKATVQKNGCTRLINIGTAADIRKSAFQEQILYIKEHLGAEYVRFWDIYGPELYLDIHASKENLHFGRIDEVIDFLVKHNLKPYIELGFKPLRLLKNTHNALMEINRDQEFRSDDEMKTFFWELMKHFVHRYGEEEVQGWYFEYWKKENLYFADLVYNFRPMNPEAHLEYYKKFDILAGIFRKILPEVKIGGGGFSLQHYGHEGFSQILTEWKQHPELPDFISLNCFPYKQEKEGNLYFEKKSTDMFFVKHNIELAKELMKKNEFPVVPLHVSEYNLTLSNRNAINDHCAKGAFLMQNAIACMEEADILGHWPASDIYADYQDAQSFLFGGGGLITKTGVPKPGFYAFEFLQHLYRNIYAKDKNYVITGNERGSYRIICHNFKNFNYNYYLADEGKIGIADIPVMFEDYDYLTIQVNLSAVENGTYILKHSRINSDFGSVQDEWKRLNMEPQLNMREQTYLKQISTPRLTMEEINVDNHRLDFEIILKPNEIQYIQVIIRQ